MTFSIRYVYIFLTILERNTLIKPATKKDLSKCYVCGLWKIFEEFYHWGRLIVGELSLQKIKDNQSGESKLNLRKQGSLTIQSSEQFQPPCFCVRNPKSLLMVPLYLSWATAVKVSTDTDIDTLWNMKKIFINEMRSSCHSPTTTTTSTHKKTVVGLRQSNCWGPPPPPNHHRNS